jgi:hypothetical protein
MILSSKDRAFHFELYEWFINKGMIKQLLTVMLLGYTLITNEWYY